MLKLSCNKKINDVELADCYGWATEYGVHFVVDSQTVFNLWDNGEANSSYTDEVCSTIFELMRACNVCDPDEVVKVLKSDKDFVIEVCA